jgi:hypothetical protein
MTIDREQQARARETLRLTVKAYNEADEDNDVTIWSDESDVVVTAMLAFADEARLAERAKVLSDVGPDLAAIGSRPAAKVLAWAKPRPCFYVNVGTPDGCVCLGCREQALRATAIRTPNEGEVS